MARTPEYGGAATIDLLARRPPISSNGAKIVTRHDGAAIVRTLLTGAQLVTVHIIGYISRLIARHR